MYEGNKEILLENYPIPITLEENYLIIEQMKNSICKIYKNKGGKGSGFFCFIPFENSKIPVLITNYHVIDNDYFKNNAIINLTLNDDKETKIIQIGNNRKIYSSDKYDTTIIEIFPSKDKINYFLELEEKIFKQNSKLFYQKESLYIMHYPKSQKVSVSYGMLKDIKDSDIFHCCSTEKGSSGSPILSLSKKRIIGIHKEGVISKNINKGTFLKYPIIEFLNIFYNQEKNNAINNNKLINLNNKKEKNIYNTINMNNANNNTKLVNLNNKKENILINSMSASNISIQNSDLKITIKESLPYYKKKDVLYFIKYEGKWGYIDLNIEENKFLYEIYNEAKNKYDFLPKEENNFYIMRNHNLILIDPSKGVKDIGLKNNDKIYLDNNNKNSIKNSQLVVTFIYEGKCVNACVEENQKLFQIIGELKNKNLIPKEAYGFFLMKDNNMVKLNISKGVKENGLKNGDKIRVININI